MPKLILLEEFHLTMMARPGLGERTYQAMHRALNKARLHAELRRAVIGVIKGYPSLSEIRVRLSR